MAPRNEDEDCDVCHGTGYICDECRAADGQCECSEGPTLVPCPEC